MQASEREFHLGLHARRMRYPAARRPPANVFKQDGLADSWLAADHKDLAIARAHRGDKPVERAAFAEPVREPCQHRARVSITQPADSHPGQASQLLVTARLAHGEDQGNRLGQQPPGRERQALHRHPVQPLHVIHQAGQRPHPGRLRQQPQHRQTHHEPVRRRPGADTERGPQRVSLR